MRTTFLLSILFGVVASAVVACGSSGNVGQPRWDVAPDVDPDAEIDYEAILADTHCDYGMRPYVNRDGKGACGMPLSLDDMVRLPSSGNTTSFLMGTPEALVPRLGEDPQVEVTLSAFYIDKREVTALEFTRCVQAGACREPVSHAQRQECNFGREGYTDSPWRDHPINCVNIEHALDYCLWAGKALPTEAQWERAARGESDRVFVWGDECPASWCDEEDQSDNLDRLGVCTGPEWNLLAWVNRPVNACQDGSPPFDQPVTYEGCWADLDVSPDGVCDLAGNLTEFVLAVACTPLAELDVCGQCCISEGYRLLESVDPPGRFTVDEQATRGGSFQSCGDHLRLARRSSITPTAGATRCGFRCVVLASELE